MRRITALALGALVAGGCSSSSSDAPAGSGGPKGDGTTTTAVIGAKGGELVHPQGAKLTVPAGALTADKTITVTSTTEGPPGSFATWASPVFHFAPDDLLFDAPASVELKFTGTPATPTLYWASAIGAPFDATPSAVVGSTVTAPIMTLGSGFVAPGTKIDPGGDKCGPYVGSWAGILEFKWSAYGAPKECVDLKPQNGVGTITVHFTTTCLGPGLDGIIVLNVTTVSTDNAYFQTPFPSPADPTLSQMNAPPNPPTKGKGAISLGFKHGSITLGPTMTVTTGALKLSSDTGVTTSWTVDQVPGDPDDEAFHIAGMPRPVGAINCTKVDSTTWKIDKL